jgi:hypothetical protein
MGVLAPDTGWAWRRAGDLEIDVVDDRGRELRQIPVSQSGRGGAQRAYLEAKRGDDYAIRVRNRSGERLGLVIAVDGRNIISGRRSDLARNERKYILGPYETAVYEGWRTGSHKVNRFYFTDAADSYADAFGDRSAMGVIAIAVYREKARRPQQLDKGGPYPLPQHRHGNAKGGAPRTQAPGTGFGETQWSPSRQVRFEPDDRAIARHFLKYEWRDTLCRKGLIECRREPRNRFWSDEARFGEAGFAPPPPDRPYRMYE